MWSSIARASEQLDLMCIWSRSSSCIRHTATRAASTWAASSLTSSATSRNASRNSDLCSRSRRCFQLSVLIILAYISFVQQVDGFLCLGTKHLRLLRGRGQFNSVLCYRPHDANLMNFHFHAFRALRSGMTVKSINLAGFIVGGTLEARRASSKSPQRSVLPLKFFRLLCLWCIEG